jgi:quercetin 2,3-dioxygenase
MKTIRSVKEILKSRPTIEGAGVRLRRAFGYHEVPRLDPFLMLDHFGSDNPDDYMAGFPWHPHRGIETVTYMLNGMVEHGDSMGNKGVIGSGDVQWMTAGSGIIHQEMPKEIKGRMQGFQLWVNLPAKKKMMDPRYRDVKKSTIPEVKNKNGAVIKVISGEIDGTKGPVRDIVVDPSFFDISLPQKTEFKHYFSKEYAVFAYVFEGSGVFGLNGDVIQKEHTIIFGIGEEVAVRSTDQQVRFILCAGKPLLEPVAWNGPIVMNTDQELETAFREYEDGTFIKAGK